MKKQHHPAKKHNNYGSFKFIAFVFSILLLPVIFWASQYPQLITSRGQQTVKNSLRPFENAILSQSKLGIFYLGTTDAGKKMYSAGPKVIKVIDPQSNEAMMQFARDYKKLYPQGLVVMRVYEGTPGIHYGLNDDPEQSAVDFFQRVLQPAVNKMSDSDKKLIDYLAGTNGYEQTPGLGPRETNDDSYWFGKFQAKLADLTHTAGFKPSIGEIYVGGPDPKYLEGFEVALQKVKEYGGVWSVHGYTLNYTTDPDSEKDTSLHYRNLNNWLKANHPEVADLPMILGEGGVDKLGNAVQDGWQARGPKEKYQEWLRWYDAELKKDPYIIAVALFQSGGENWPSFNIDPLADWLVNYYQGQPQTTTPTPTQTAVSPTAAVPSPTLATTPSLTSAPTLTPAITPSPAPTLTPSPTPTPAELPKIKFKAKLAYIQTYPEIYFKLRVKDESSDAIPKRGKLILFSAQSICNDPPPGVKDYYIPAKADSSGIYMPVPKISAQAPEGIIPVISDDGWIILPDQLSGKKYTFVLKAPKTRGKKMAEKILLTSGKQYQEFDWTGFPLEPGDLPNPTSNNKQDCVINSLDLSLVISRLGKTDKESLSIADVNYDAVINGNDLAKIIPAVSREDDDL